MEFDGDIIEHNIHDVNSIDSVCWINALYLLIRRILMLI